MKKPLVLLLLQVCSIGVLAQNFRWHTPMVVPAENGGFTLAGISANANGRLAIGGRIKTSFSLGSLSLTNSGIPYDGYLVVVDSSGGVLWHKQFTGANVQCSAPAMDMLGNVYVLVDGGGASYSVNGGAAGLQTRTDRYALHVFDPSGNWIRASTLVTGGIYVFDVPQDEIVIRTTVGPNGEACIVGYFYGSGVTITGPTSTLTVPAPSGGTTPYPFVLKLLPNGDPAWMYAYDRSQGISYQDVAIDGGGNVFVAGNVEERNALDFDPSPGVAKPYIGSGQDGFVQKFSPTGVFQWVKQLDVNSSFMYVRGLAISGNHIRLVGDYSGQVDLDPSTAEHVISTTKDNDAFVLSLSTDGNFEGVRSCGGFRYQYGTNVDHAANGDVFVVGVFSDTLRYEGLFPSFSATGYDHYLLRLDANGNLKWLVTLPFSADGTRARRFFASGGSSYLFGLPVVNENADLDFGPGQQLVTTSTAYTLRALIQYGDQTVVGCTDPSSSNYAPTAIVDNGLCIRPGCTNPSAFNYAATANWDDGSCVLPSAACIADLNGDGAVDVADFGIFVAHFGVACPP